jgi:DNA-binding IclR family transcriptional regulator
MSENDQVRGGGSESARRIIEILFSFSETSPKRSVRELSALLDIPAPSVHRYTAQLRQLGLVTEAAKGVYQLTPRVMVLGRAAAAANTLLDAARPHLAALSAELDETVLLVQLTERGPVCVDRYESTRVLRTSFQPGQFLPPLSGASAKVLLGSLHPKERNSYIQSVGAKEDALNWREEWDDELNLAGERGWSTSNEEVNEGVWAASAAVADQQSVIGAISVSCPMFRLSESIKEDILQHLRRTAHQISVDFKLGLTPPP